MPSPPTFDEYRDKYENVRMEREDGVLVLRFHTNGDSLVWTQQLHDELPYLFTELAGDRENEVLVMAGVGDAFCADLDFATFQVRPAEKWDNILYEGRRLLSTLLSIPVPVVAAVNGPALYHPEIAVMSDITIASETASFRDTPHFPSGVVPGDGTHIVWTHLLGVNRGRYFLLTGQLLSARQALDYGVVNEVVQPDQAVPRALELAREIAAKPTLTRRYARDLLTHEYKRLFHEAGTTGLALQGLATQDSWVHG
jgi:enoyl-CoA hydratase/carnithine racemase